MTGRQMLFLFLVEHRADEAMAPMARVEQFTKMEYPGDEHMETFYKNYCDLDERDDNLLREEGKMTGLFAKLQKSQELHFQIQQFDLLPKGHKDKTNDFLKEMMRVHLRKRKERANTINNVEQSA